MKKNRYETCRRNRKAESREKDIHPCKDNKGNGEIIIGSKLGDGTREQMSGRRYLLGITGLLETEVAGSRILLSLLLLKKSKFSP